MITELVVKLLISGATLAAKSAVGEFGKGAGKDLVSKIIKYLDEKYKIKPEKLQKDQFSESDKTALISEIEKSGLLNDPDAIQMIENLRKELEQHSKSASYAIVDSTFEADKDILAKHVEGLKNVQMTSKGTIDLSGAKSPGK